MNNLIFLVKLYFLLSFEKTIIPQSISVANKVSNFTESGRSEKVYKNKRKKNMKTDIFET